MPSISSNQGNRSERADREFGDNAGAVRTKIMLTELMPSISSNQTDRLSPIEDTFFKIGRGERI